MPRLLWFVTPAGLSISAACWSGDAGPPVAHVPIGRWYSVRTALQKQGIHVEPRDSANPDKMVVTIPSTVAIQSTKRPLDYMATMIGSRLGEGAYVILQNEMGNELDTKVVW
jgi:hypothetical protein